MDISTIIKKLKLVLSEKKLNNLGRDTGFMKRKRNVSPFQLVIAMIGSLGEKDTRYLSDILRYFNQLTGQSVKYKPFHNQLSKLSLSELMRQVAEKVFSHWVNTVLKSNKPVFQLFKQINIHDGSSFSVHRGLKDLWPGRFTQISPAAVELHVMMNLKTGSFERVSLTPDSYSERAEVADSRELSGQLFLADRGYYSGRFILQLDQAGGYYVLRAKGLKRVIEDNDEEKGLKLGAADYILKPIKPATMLARVKGQLAIKEAHDFLNNKNTILEAEVVKRLKENQNIQNVSIRALAHLAETRDPETGDHILRTQSYVQVLAKHLKESPRFKSVITDHFIREVTKSAPLHDIGKVGIPDSILLKPGKLTPEEWEIMKTHSEMGARAIENAETDFKQPVEFLSLAKEIAHWHHERWDGTGYPDNLSGENIPLSARLMAVADVFDALVSPRVYKAPMPYIDARDVIMAEKESHFDPDISDAFLACFDKFVEIAQKYDNVLT